MTNQQIYKKTLTFSVRRMLYDFLAFFILAVLGGAGFFLMEKVNDKGLIGLTVGLLIGLIALIFILRYGSYTFKAGQIAMMTKGVTENELPEDVFHEGIRTVQERFVTIAVFFAITGAIKGIFNQLSRGLNSLGKSIGGENGGSVADIISSAIQVVVAYLCDCCLGWIFYRKEENAARAACEGAVLFFRHGKTLLKNLGRVFGISILSLLVIGGVFLLMFYAIFSLFPAAFELLTHEIAEAAVQMGETLPEVLSTTNGIMFACAGIAALILWSILHSVFVRPYILVGVLRNYMESGMNEVPTEASFAMLDSKSSKFKKLHTQAT